MKTIVVQVQEVRVVRGLGGPGQIHKVRPIIEIVLGVSGGMPAGDL